MTLKVVHAGTGPVGLAALDGILNHPELELAGMFVQSPEKIGKDAGSFVARSPTGVITTNDWDALVALKADCLSYHANSIGREVEAANDVCRFLEAGTNAVTTSVFAWAYPPDVPPDFAKVHDACAKGRSSAFFSGSDPGWGTTDLALAALAMADKVDFIRVGRYGYWGGWGAEYVCRYYYGFGQPPDFTPMLISGGFLKQNWGPALKHICAAIGVSIDGWNVVWETAQVDHDTQCGFGIVKAGSNAALRTELQALHEGRPVAVFAHVDRAAEDAGPDWEKPHTPGAVAFRIEVEGDHSYMIEFTSVAGKGRRAALTPTERLVVSGKSTAMPTINAIPAVCRAPPGLLGPLDVPFSGVGLPRWRG
jgi:4-hydroxy-tetrahydrodipicolinate reductase